MKYREYHPSHIYLDKTFYFVTSRTINKFNYFDFEEKKNLLKNILNKTIKTFKISLYAWVILDNHYHLLFYLDNKNNLAKFIRHLNGRSSCELNKSENISSRQIWYQYWDRCIRNEADFFKHFNYVHNNPIKHKKIKSLEELSNYEFSSFNTWLN